MDAIAWDFSRITRQSGTFYTLKIITCYSIKVNGPVVLDRKMVKEGCSFNRTLPLSLGGLKLKPFKQSNSPTPCFTDSRFTCLFMNRISTFGLNHSYSH